MSTKSTPATQSTITPATVVEALKEASKPEAKATTAKVAKPKTPAKAKATKAEAAKEVKFERPAKLTAAFIKEMVAKGLSPLTGKPIRHYSRDGKRYAKKDAAKTAKTAKTAKAVKATKTPVKEAKPEAVKPATKASIPVLKAKKAPAKVATKKA